MTQPERRRFERLKRKFMVTYHRLDEPHTSFDISQIKNISLGGMCFVASHGYEPGTKLAIELQTPFIRDKLSLSAEVLESKEVAKNLIYETRVRFPELKEDTKHYLSKIIETFLKKDKEKEKE
jgi:c-di-GMP-binding flagellar brake protein YcgR